MKKPLLLFLLIIIGFLGHTQITVTEAVLPDAGDTLHMNVVANFDSWTPDNGGANMTWDFTNPGPSVQDDRFFLDPSMGVYSASFPDAQLLSGTNSETYFSKDSDGMYLLGFSGENPVTNEPVAVVMDAPYTQIKTPMVYDETWSDDNSIYIGINLDSIDQSILDQIPFNFDTARLKVTFQTDAHFDAWGELTTPTGTYATLRENRTSMTSFGVEIFFFSWVDVTEYLPQNEFFQNDTTQTYTFFNNTMKEPVAEVTTDSNFDFQTLRYRRDVTVGINDIDNNNATFEASPNPAINDISFYYGGLEEGQYELRIFNIIGAELLSEDFKVNNPTGVYYTDVSSLRQGTYFYSLKDSFGNTLMTKRLVIIRP